MATFSVSNNGLTIVAEAFGEGEPLIFAHGLTGSRQLIVRQFQALAGSYRITTFDQRGHGESSPVTDPALYDPLHPFELAERMVSLIPNATLVPISIEDHSGTPGRIGEFYAEFLAGLA